MMIGGFAPLPPTINQYLAASPTAKNNGTDSARLAFIWRAVPAFVHEVETGRL